MSLDWQLHLNRASEAEIFSHLARCDDRFVPRLSARVDLAAYAHRLHVRASRFEAWAGGDLVGLIAAYFDDEGGVAFISNVSVDECFLGKGIASALLARTIAHAGSAGCLQVRLRVGAGGAEARRLYEKHGFRACLREGEQVLMQVDLQREDSMATTRDYDIEGRDVAGHKYAYGFDFDVMHPYMVRSFEPFFRTGSLLELGSYRGDFTIRLTPHFDDITCVEASEEALTIARNRLGDKATIVHARFETVQLPRRYDNIVLTHVLEHLDDPVAVLRRANEEWLAEGGRLFLVCPNANAPSRQIAVKMGLIDHNAAVTPAEGEHGHRITYSLDTLERDATRAGLRVVHRSGIFFKALANFQWDRLLQTDIVSPQYLDGCYMLGQQYPDLCASIFLLCESSAGAR